MAPVSPLEDHVHLPTLSRLNTRCPENIDQVQIASGWIQQFGQSLLDGNSEEIISLFCEDGLWRDLLAFTWDFRTFHGISSIRCFLEDRLQKTVVKDVRLSSGSYKEPVLYDEIPGLVWIQALFEFTTAIGECSGVVRLVPTEDGTWKAHCILTNLDRLTSPESDPSAVSHTDDLCMNNLFTDSIGRPSKLQVTQKPGLSSLEVDKLA